MSEEKDLWELVRQKISDSETNDVIKRPKIMAEEKTLEAETETKEAEANPEDTEITNS